MISFSKFILKRKNSSTKLEIESLSALRILQLI